MSDVLENSDGNGLDEINDCLADAGFVLDIEATLSDESTEFTEDELIDMYKQIFRAMKLLLLSENLDCKKLQQAMYLAQDLK